MDKLSSLQNHTGNCLILNYFEQALIREGPDKEVEGLM